MKKIFLLFIIIIPFFSYSIETLGNDSGGNPINLFENNKKSDTVLLIIGGIHADERDTVKAANYLKSNLKSDLKIYYIPNLNPTLYNIKINKRGYLREHLDSKGYVKPGSPLQDFDKKLYYRIFYGNKNTYLNGKDHYIDPNRDFAEQVLPTTKILINLIEQLKSRHKSIIILSLHGYMAGGRIYPEYKVLNNKIIVDDYAWEIAAKLEEGSGFIKEKMYSPALKIIERFSGELIAYTGTIDNVIAFDIELDSLNRAKNNKNVLTGVEHLSNYLLTRKRLKKN